MYIKKYFKLIVTRDAKFKYNRSMLNLNIVVKILVHTRCGNLPSHLLFKNNLSFKIICAQMNLMLQNFTTQMINTRNLVRKIKPEQL